MPMTERSRTHVRVFAVRLFLGSVLQLLLLLSLLVHPGRLFARKRLRSNL
jgi:hypothetical protein